MLEGRGVQHEEAEIRRRPLDRGLGSGGDRRLEFGDLGLHHVGAEDEIAAVPEIALVDVALRRRAVGLLDESVKL